jgi:hypothetical protein
MSTDELLAKGLRLTRVDRARVAEELLSSLEESDDEVATAWTTELERRSRDDAEARVQTTTSPDGLLIVDYGATGRPVGVEITSPQAVPLERLNQLLAELAEAPLAEQDYQPLRAA